MHCRKNGKRKDEAEIVGGHEETEPEEQNAVNDLVNLAQVQLNHGDETGDNQVLPLDWVGTLNPF